MIKSEEFKFKMQRDIKTWQYLLENAADRDNELKIQAKTASYNIGVYQNN
jgi:hypothetical protein